MKHTIKESHRYMERRLQNTDSFHYYKGEGYFIGNNTIKINDEKIKGEKIFIGSGARPLIPKIKGLEGIDYLTNETIFNIFCKNTLHRK